ncbi:hypothetical protein EDB83DRAFT_2428698 [Lactarius deliciosus]|nr:hypothetical protein EDB83DRAFT_2428698 [Lactarius deliciosus]
MAASAVYTQVSAGGYPHAYDMPPPLTPLSATLVETTRHIERPSIELKFSSSGANIVNSVIATVEWDRSSPRMVFRGKKIKCKEWLPLAGPDTECVLILLSYDLNTAYRLSLSQTDRLSQLIPANRPGLAVAKWRTKSRTDELLVKIFQEALVESGLLEAIILSIVLLQSGHSFGDRLEMTSLGPKYYAAGTFPGAR